MSNTGIATLLSTVVVGVALTTSALAGSVIKQQRTMVDEFGNRITKTRIVKTDDLGNRVTGTNVTRTDRFGNKISKTKIERIDEEGVKIAKTKTSVGSPFGTVTKVKVTKMDTLGG